MKLANLLCMTFLTTLTALRLFSAPPSVALNQISWVASGGSDTNSCDRTSPCLTFQHAHDVTVANGIVKAADAGEYGPLSITKGITIDGNSVGAEIATNFFTAISVSAPPTALVTIRDLSLRINGRGISGTSNMHIENVMIVGNPTAVGVIVSYSTFSPMVSAKNLTVVGVNDGFILQGGSVTIRDSVFRGNSFGLEIGGDGLGHAGTALIERSEISFNAATGLSVAGSDPGIITRISDCVITGNGTGISAAGGQIITFRTNMLAGNTTDGSTPFSASLK